MAYQKGTIVWKALRGGSKNHTKESNLTDCYSLSYLGTLINGLATKTKCKARRYSVVYGQHYSVVDPSAGSTCDRTAIIHYRDTTSGNVRQFTLPSPVDSICETVASGERLKLADAEAIVALLATATDRPLTFLYSYVLQVS
jgi:hypothetical protein